MSIHPCLLPLHFRLSSALNVLRPCFLDSGSVSAPGGRDTSNGSVKPPNFQSLPKLTEGRLTGLHAIVPAPSLGGPLLLGGFDLLVLLVL